MAMLYLCILYLQPFVSTVLHSTTSNMAGYNGRIAGFPLGEEKLVSQSGQRKEKAPFMTTGFEAQGTPQAKALLPPGAHRLLRSV